MTGVVRRAGYALIERSLRRTFRRIAWMGALQPPPANRPVVLYANHHLFHDAYILAWCLERVLRRRTLVWMADYDRFPFFGMLGAQPMPAGDAARRATTVRRTARALARDASGALLYYPEGRLHPADDGIAPFPPTRCLRIARVLPRAWWWPVALRVTGFHDAHPTVLLAGGAWTDGATGDEAERLRALLAGLGAAVPGEATVLLDGARGPHERWRFTRRGRDQPRPGRAAR